MRMLGPTSRRRAVLWAAVPAAALRNRPWKPHFVSENPDSHWKKWPSFFRGKWMSIGEHGWIPWLIHHAWIIYCIDRGTSQNPFGLAPPEIMGQSPWPCSDRGNGRFYPYAFVEIGKSLMGNAVIWWFNQTLCQRWTLRFSPAFGHVSVVHHAIRQKKVGDCCKADK